MIGCISANITTLGMPDCTSTFALLYLCTTPPSHYTLFSALPSHYYHHHCTTFAPHPTTSSHYTSSICYSTAYRETTTQLFLVILCLNNKENGLSASQMHPLSAIRGPAYCVFRLSSSVDNNHDINILSNPSPSSFKLQIIVGGEFMQVERQQLRIMIYCSQQQ